MMISGEARWFWRNEATLMDKVAVLASRSPPPLVQRQPDKYPSWLALQTS
jgi:hypothetical protein